ACLRGLSKDPEARHASAAELAGEVQQWLAELAQRRGTGRGRGRIFALSLDRRGILDHDGRVTQADPALAADRGRAPGGRREPAPATAGPRRRRGGDAGAPRAGPEGGAGGGLREPDAVQGGRAPLAVVERNTPGGGAAGLHRRPGRDRAEGGGGGAAPAGRL